MKLSEYAKRHSISYRTAHRHWKQGFIKGSQLASGTIVVEEESSLVVRTKHRGLFVASYGRQINADINGAANILRKVFPNAFADGIQGVVVRPVRLTPYKVAA